MQSSTSRAIENGHGTPSSTPATESPRGAGAISPASGAAPGMDRRFADPTSTREDFRFDGPTVAVFDDMVSRSVPWYGEIQRMSCELAADFARPGTRVYDYGCSTGTTLLALDPLVGPDVAFVGVDSSQSMLERARAKLAGVAERREVSFQVADLERDEPAHEASVVMMLLTLQFIRPLHRERLMAHVHDALVDEGCLVLVEKIVSPHGLINRQFIQHYYELKRRNGYSDDEIARKREALENVLVPYRFAENVALLERAGFVQIEEFFRWYNFCGVIAVKSPRGRGG